MIDFRNKYSEQMEALSSACRLLGNKGLTSSVGGNLSYRVSPEHILITPTNMPKGSITANDICVVDYEGNTLYAREGLSSTSEVAFHTMIMRQRKDAMSAVHAHSTALSAFAVCKEHWLELPLFPEPMMEIGPIVTVPYIEPSSKALADQIEAYVHRSNGFLLENHGALAISPVSPADAVEKLNMMESIANSVHMALSMGTLKTLTYEETVRVAELQKIKGLCSATTPITEAYRF